MTIPLSTQTCLILQQILRVTRVDRVINNVARFACARRHAARRAWRCPPPCRRDTSINALIVPTFNRLCPPIPGCHRKHNHVTIYGRTRRPRYAATTRTFPVQTSRESSRRRGGTTCGCLGSLWLNRSSRRRSFRNSVARYRAILSHPSGYRRRLLPTHVSNMSAIRTTTRR